MLFMIATLSVNRSKCLRGIKSERKLSRVKTRWQLRVLYVQVDASGVNACLQNLDLQEIDREGREVARSSKLDMTNRSGRVVYFHDAQGAPQTSLVFRVGMLAARFDSPPEQGHG